MLLLLKLVPFDGVAAILVCKGERDLGKVSKLLRGAGVGVSCRLPTRASLGSLDTLPRSRSRKMAAALSKPTSLRVDN